MQNRFLRFICAILAGTLLLGSFPRNYAKADSDWDPVWPVESSWYARNLDIYAGGARHSSAWTKNGGDPLDIAYRRIDKQDQNVYAIESGKVTDVGNNTSEGHHVEISHHNNGYESRYLHLKSTPCVAEGDTVTKGQIIGTMGSTGASTGVHLHIDIKLNGIGVSAIDQFKVKYRTSIVYSEEIVKRGTKYKDWILTKCKLEKNASMYNWAYYVAKCKTHIWNDSGYCANCGEDFMDTAARPVNAPTRLITTKDAPIRNRPFYYGSEILVKVPPHQELTADQHLDNQYAGYTWYHVSYNGKTGYIYKDNVTIVSDKKTFTIVFDANQGSNAPKSAVYIVGEKAELPGTQPIRSGYSFKGWATNPKAFLAQYDGGGSYAFSTQANSTLTLYAIWAKDWLPASKPTPAPKAHKCSYGTDGYCKTCGKEYAWQESPMNAVYVASKAEIAIWNRPYSTNSTRMDDMAGVCVGKGEPFTICASLNNHLGHLWYRISGGRFDGCYVYSKNVTLSKQAAPTVADPPTPPPSAIQSAPDPAGPQAVQPPTPTFTPSPIPGRATLIENGTYYISVPANRELRLYRTYTDTVSFTYISAKSAAYPIMATVKATKPNGEVWYFFRTGDGKDVWFLYQPDMTIPTPVPNKVTLYFDANGGRLSLRSIDGYEGEMIQLEEEIPSWDGYWFLGWSFDPSDTTELLQPGSAVTIYNSRTLYAVWESTAAESAPQPIEEGSGPAPGYEPAAPQEAPSDTPTPISGERITLDVPYYYAADPRWSGMTLGNSSYTVGESGGFITCMAMYETYRLGYEETPETLIHSGRAQFSNSGGLLFACDLYDPYKGADYSCQRIYDLLRQNKPVIVWANNGGKDHAVICYAFYGDPANMKNADFLVHDPLNGTSTLGEWSGFGRICYYP